MRFSSHPVSLIRVPGMSATSAGSLLVIPPSSLLARRLQILQIVFVLLISYATLAQSSSDGSFSVRHLTMANYSLDSAQMREAEKIYSNVCFLVQRDFHRSALEVHPHFTVIIGTDRNVVSTRRGPGEQNDEIWMKKWDPFMFAQGVVVVTFDQMLTPDVIRKLGKEGALLSGATVDVADLR